MFIGEVSKKTGLTVKAIRLYEDLGLIKPPRRQGRYRVYAESDIEVLKLIAEAKQLGVKLAELKDTIVYSGDQVDWQRIEHFLYTVKDRLEQEQKMLLEKLKSVEACIESLNSCSRAG